MERRELIRDEEGAGLVVTVQHQRRKGGCTFCSGTFTKALIKEREVIWEKGVTLGNIGESGFWSGWQLKVENMDW